MSVVYEILFDAGKILAYFLIALSFIVSGFILFKPALVLRVNNRLNTWFCTKIIGEKMDSSVDTTETVLKYRWLIGTLFLFGSLYTAKYMLMDFNLDKFVGLVVKPSDSSLWLYEILFQALKWLFVFCSLAGFIACLILLFNPDLFRRISHKLDKAVSTEKVGVTLDATNNLFDSWVLKHHIAMGLFLFLASCYLVVVFLFKYV